MRDIAREAGMSTGLIQRAGEFRAGDPADLATCWFAAVSGLATMKAALGDRFRAPDPATLTGILTREHR